MAKINGYTTLCCIYKMLLSLCQRRLSALFLFVFVLCNVQFNCCSSCPDLKYELFQLAQNRRRISQLFCFCLTILFKANGGNGVATVEFLRLYIPVTDSLYFRVSFASIVRLSLSLSHFHWPSPSCSLARLSPPIPAVPSYFSSTSIPHIQNVGFV